jgi:hypothetical protein
MEIYAGRRYGAGSTGQTRLIIKQITQSELSNFGPIAEPIAGKHSTRNVIFIRGVEQKRRSQIATVSSKHATSRINCLCRVLLQYAAKNTHR